jgi:hypothetical protein
MHEIEVIKFNKQNIPIAKKIMTLDDWVVFNKRTELFYYKAYQIGYSQYLELKK